MANSPFCDSFFRQGGFTGVLLFHGFTATTFEVKGLADELHAAGYTVSAPLLPGHGTTPDDLNHVKWQDWMQTAENALADLKKNCRFVFVGGESMGGLISLLLAHNHPEIKGLLLYAPAIESRKLWITPLLKYFIKFSKKRNSDDLFEWQGYSVNPVAGAAQLYSLQYRAVRILKTITQPLIIFQGKNDRTVSPSGALKAYKTIPSFDKEIVWLDCGHCILLDADFEDVAKRSLEFIRRINEVESR
jgi:carboxylesterase